MKDKIEKGSISKIFLVLYFFLIVFLFLFSYTQVDLGLTLTRASLLTDIQKAFQYVGYFNRPLSTLLYIVCVAGLFGCYFYLIKKASSIPRKFLWTLIILTTCILAFSYNAFSYDIFNYIFDAKIFTHYGLNPYLHKALDFPGDPMLSFMHWTHRVYPYGPIWLGLTIPLSYLGYNFFIPTFFLFKLLMGGSFLLTAFFLEKIERKFHPQNSLLALVLFAFNPFILIESLVSAHNDIVMMAICMIGIYFLVSKRFFLAVIFIIFSAAIKFATGILLPVIILLWMASAKKIKIEWDKIFPIFTLSLFFAVGAASLQSGNFQPWYLIFVVPFLILGPKKKYMIIPLIILSVGAICSYIPYLYLGNDSYHITYLLPTITLITTLAAAIAGILLYKVERSV